MDGEERVSSGVAGIDEITKGGFFPASSYLILGVPGTGKTVFSLQWLSCGVPKGAPSLYVTFAEPEEVIRRNARCFGWALEEVNFFDFTTDLPFQDKLGAYQIFSPSEVEQVPVWQRLNEVVEKYSPSYVVIDSATFLKYLSPDEYQFRKNIQLFVNLMERRRCITLFLYEPTELKNDLAIALASSGILVLRNEISTERLIEIRTVEVEKFRGTSYHGGRHALRIHASGITVFPHVVEKIAESLPERGTLSTGISELDEMLGGGLALGEVTIISGPTGTGKTTLVTQFLVSAARSGMKGVLYAFDEAGAFTLGRSSKIGIPLERYCDTGTVNICQINPLDLYPDEFLSLVRHHFQEGRRLFALDSIRGYLIAMSEFGNLVANLQNISHFLRGHGGTLVLVNEMEALTGDLQVTESGVSYFSDTILLLRYAELAGELIKVISCLKKRTGGFQPDLREFRITSEGIHVGQKLAQLRGILTGVPTR